jgi:hypothetical protein
MIDFEIILNDLFSKFSNEKKINPISNKHILSIANDFEDGFWRQEKFNNFIWNSMSETCLTKSERERLINQPRTLLTEAVKNLRLIDKSEEDKSEEDKEKTEKKPKELNTEGSELAEIFLYGIMKNFYNALPVVPKIFYKQNINDNAKGADSVHIVVEGENDFSLWFGESKFYNNIEDARLYEIVHSVKNSLETDKLKKENSIITGLKELEEFTKDNPDLRKKIIDSLSTNNSIDNLKSKIHIPILILYECNLTQTTNDLSTEYKKNLSDYHIKRAESYFKKQVSIVKDSVHMYEKIHFHIILFPVPSKIEIVQRFLSEVKFFRS